MGDMADDEIKKIERESIFRLRMIAVLLKKEGGKVAIPATVLEELGRGAEVIIEVHEDPFTNTVTLTLVEEGDDIERK